MAPEKKEKILFLCTGNSCRSQMAEGLTRQLKGDVMEAYSAGVSPKQVDPLAVKAMARIGIDISDQTSKDLDVFSDETFDYVVTLCDHANEACPMFFGQTQKVHVGFDDPPALAQGAKNEDEALIHYERVRDEIRAFVKQLPGSVKTKQ